MDATARAMGSGTWRWREAGYNLRASFGNSSNYADGSAKFRRMFANVNGRTDFKINPFTQYDRSGNAALSWYDDFYCHPLLFRPDFENWGSPYEGI